MKTIAALQAWKNFSEYYSAQVGEIIKDKYELTVTYNQDIDYLNKFDIVWSFFPQFPKYNDGPRLLDNQLVKTFWEPHEMGWDKGKVNVACSTSRYRMLLQSDSNAKYAPLGINTDVFKPQPFTNKKVTVGWAGEKLNARKNFKELEVVMGCIDGVDFTPNITTCIHGDLIGKYEITPEMTYYYNSIDIYVCASANEGFGLPLLEASACGRPIVTFDVGIAHELKDDGAGVIIVNTYEQMKEAIIWLSEKRERIQEWGNKSRKAVQEYWQWHYFRDAWLKVFDGIYE